MKNEYSLYIRNFDQKQIYTNQEYLDEIEKLRTKKAYQCVNTYLQDQIFDEGSTEVKLGYLNINSLVNKVKDVDNDKNLCECDVLVLSETRLPKKSPINLENWKISKFDLEDKNSKAPHMGLAMLIKKTSEIEINAKVSVIKLSGSTIFQYLEVYLKGIGIKGIMYYVNKKPSKKDIEKIVKHFKKLRWDFFIGDLNLNHTELEDRKRVSILTKGLNLKSVLHQTTRSKAHLDHIMIHRQLDMVTYATSYSNLYTDHAAITLRISKDGKFTSEFVEDQIRKQELNYLIHQDPVISEEKKKFEKKQEENEEIGERDVYPEEDMIMRGKNFILYERELQRLSPPRFLSDELINAYMHLISEKYNNLFIFDTHFHSSLQTSKFSEKRGYVNVNPFQFNTWLMPLNFQNCHWILLCINVENLDRGELAIDLYDSAREMDFTYDIQTDELCKYIRFMCEKYKNLKVDHLNIIHQNVNRTIPQQSNDYDCGVYVLAYAICLAANETMNFDQAIIDVYRQNLRHEFKRKSLDEACLLFVREQGNQSKQTQSKLNKGKKREARKSFKSQRQQKREKQDSETLSQRYQSSRKPIGLINLGNTCYFNALIQSLNSLPLVVNAIHLDSMNLGNDVSLASQIAKLFDGIDKRRSLNDLRKLTLDVLEHIWQRFGREYQAGAQEDVEGFYFHMKMILNENQNSKTTTKNFSSLEETKENYELSCPSNITKPTTIYAKVVRNMHDTKTCVTETYERFPSLLLPIQQTADNGNNDEFTTVETLIANYVAKTECEEKIRCSVCSSPNSTLTQETILVDLPDVLVLTLERYIFRC